MTAIPVEVVELEESTTRVTRYRRTAIDRLGVTSSVQVVVSVPVLPDCSSVEAAGLEAGIIWWCLSGHREQGEDITRC